MSGSSTNVISHDVVVVGSCMIDLVCYTSRMPKVGETIPGTNFEIGNGGKGANQCVAAAKLGASTALIARVGNDDFGLKYKNTLTSYGVNTDNVLITDNETSGMAQITVSENGDNIIIIVAGANLKLSNKDIEKAKEVILKSKVVIFQLETPIDVTIDTLKMIKANGGPLTIVNAAPAIPNIDHSLLKLCDVFIVNEIEAAAITSCIVANVGSAQKAAAKLLSLGCKYVILTLGGNGVVFGSSPSDLQHVSVEKITPVDTTGAGDAFVGAFGFFTAQYPSMTYEDRVKRSAVVATQSVLSKGTQTSYPLRSNLPKSLFEL